MTRPSLTLLMRWGSITLTASALATFTYCGFVLTEAWFFQKEQLRNFEAQLRKPLDVARKASTVPAVLHVPSPSPSPSASHGGLIGRLEIKRIGLEAMVIEGTDARTLRHAVGHIPGTALPGSSGNTGLAAHRDTYFRPLQDTRENDLIRLTTTRGVFRYRVVSLKIVKPDNVTVLDPIGRETLTLVTCHPFTFVGAAPMRFIVQAERLP